MKLRYIGILLTLFLVASSCVKYEKDADYATLQGSLIDKFTNTTLDVGQISLEPSKVVNGFMNLDPDGNFTNTRILPGEYTILASLDAAFTSDSAKVEMQAGKETKVSLTIEPWISVQSAVVSVVDTTITITYTIQGNKGFLPARHLVAWSTSPKPKVTSYPGGNRNFYTPATGQENGTFTYKIEGLEWNTTYFIVAGARLNEQDNPEIYYNYGRQIIVTTAKK